jgi:hypothetical protein
MIKVNVEKTFSLDEAALHFTTIKTSIQEVKIALAIQ